MRRLLLHSIILIYAMVIPSSSQTAGSVMGRILSREYGENNDSPFVSYQQPGPSS